jgi:type II secretory pathway component GspD/PulD (secretin)
MIRRGLLILFASGIAHAEPVSLNFKNVAVVNFAEATYKTMLGKDYMITPDVIGLDKKVTLSVKSIERDKLPMLLADVLASVGVRAREASGIVYIERASASEDLSPASDGAVKPRAQAPIAAMTEPDDFEVYHPKNRTVEYLQMLLRSVGVSNGPGQQQQGQSVAQDYMIVAGSDERRAKVLKLLAQLDQKPVVMNVRAAVVEFSDTKDESFSLGAVLSILQGRMKLAVNSGLVPAGDYATLKMTSIDAVVKALNGDSRFRFRTQPSLRLVDGEQGKLMVGSEVPVRGALTLSKDGTPIQSIEYRSSGLVLTIQPRALDGRYSAKITQEVSSFASTSTSNIDSPTLNKRSLDATVEAEDGEVVVLAGLDEETTSEGRSGLFFLPWITTSKTTSSRNTQLMVLLEIKRI